MAANGFAWRWNVSGGRPLMQSFYMKDTETLTVGDMLNLESGEVDLMVTIPWTASPALSAGLTAPP